MTERRSMGAIREILRQRWVQGQPRWAVPLSTGRASGPSTRRCAAWRTRVSTGISPADRAPERTRGVGHARASWARLRAHEHRRGKLHDQAPLTRRAGYRRVDATRRARAVGGVDAHGGRGTEDRREAEAAAAAPTDGANRRAGDVGLGGRRGGGRRHDRGGRGRRRGDGAGSRPWTARHVPYRTHAEALMHASALDAGVEGARVTVVAAARAGTRPDARRKVRPARGVVVLSRGGAPAETAGPVGRGPATPDAGSCPGHDTLRACGEVLAATVQEGASTRSWGRERRARPEAVVMGAVAGIPGAAELVHAVAFACPQARRRDGRTAVLLASERGDPRRLKAGSFLESASGSTDPRRSGSHDCEGCTE
jgi:hypothetical protein